MPNTHIATRPIVGALAEQPLAALTFDDGPDPDGTPAVLAALARHRASATFFVLGRNAVRYPDLMRRIAVDGHQIANHTYAHPCMVGLSPLRTALELMRCERALRRTRVRRGRWMRPPFGAIDARACTVARLCGYRVVNWSVAGMDWTGADTDAIAAHVLEGLRPGAIVLLHDGLEPPADGRWPRDVRALRDRRPMVEALSQVLGQAESRSIEWVTVDALLRRAAPELA
jgi:peptidoglycan/xylan/chitin deacetylase (PgdA/CDA1 family)